MYPYRPGDYATLTRKYLGSLYWSTLTLTTIGDLPTPETNAEYVDILLMNFTQTQISVHVSRYNLRKSKLQIRISSFAAIML